MKKDEIKQITDAITGRIDIEKIYCVDNSEQGGCHLILLLPNIAGLKPAELEPFVLMGTGGRKDITFALYMMTEVKDALRKGNLFFHIACIGDNIVYEKQGSPDLAERHLEKLADWRSEAVRHFNDGLDKTISFLEGVDFYKQRQDTGLTVFMLHQAFELTYRALELAISGKEKKTHDIGTHQAYIIPFVPQLGKLFPNDTDDEREMLKTLSKAYSGVRYEQHYRIEDRYIPQLFERVEEIQKRSKQIISHYSSVFEKKSELALLKIEDQILAAAGPAAEEQNHLEIMATSASNEEKCGDELNKVIDLLVYQIEPEQIYLFGKKESRQTGSNLFLTEDCFRNKTALRYDLLVVSSTLELYSRNLSGSVNAKSGVQINMFVHSRKDVLKNLDRGNRFFLTVIGKGQCVYAKPEQIPLPVVPADQMCDCSEAWEHTSRRLIRAEAMLKTAGSASDEANDVAAGLLARAMEQACLGIIYYFLGYAPNRFSLPHLLDTCAIFWPEVTDIFPACGPEEKRLLAILSENHSQLRYDVGIKIEKEDLDRLFGRCGHFIASATSLYPEPACL